MALFNSRVLVLLANSLLETVSGSNRWQKAISALFAQIRALAREIVDLRTNMDCSDNFPAVPTEALSLLKCPPSFAEPLADVTPQPQAARSR